LNVKGIKLQFSKYSAQLTMYDEKQDVFCPHDIVHSEHYAKSLVRQYVVNNTIT